MGPRRTSLLVLCAVLAARSAAGQSASPLIAADDASAPIGTSVTVSVRTSTPITVGSTDLVLGFDPTVLVATAAGSTLDGFTAAIDDTLGTVATASATGGAGQSIAAGAVLFTVTFRVRSDAAAGCTPLTIADADRTPPDDLASPVPPIPPVPIVYATRPGSFCVATCGTCDDDDRCTIDACDRATVTCRHTDQAPTGPVGVTCSIQNLRSVLSAPPNPVCARRCPQVIERQLLRVEGDVTNAAAAPTARRCRQELRAATRSAKALKHRITRLAARGAFVPGERGTRLAAEATRLTERAKTLSLHFCKGPST